ncbi:MULTISPECIES: hypothetical protein [Streptomyces]|uniref:hypothetical protein n=1 Tax=Streptomyces TaxID=1883 RepID=UPI000CF22A9E|nr:MULTISPECIES: hypothetical protein [Streptomyces]PPS75762.1 hypothetical protein BV882_09070 [Streptomyces sp. 46]
MVTTPQGTVTTPQGMVTTPQVTVTTPQGMVTTPQVTVTTPQGTVTTPQADGGCRSRATRAKALRPRADASAQVFCPTRNG